MFHSLQVGKKNQLNARPDKDAPKPITNYENNSEVANQISSERLLESLDDGLTLRAKSFFILRD